MLVFGILFMKFIYKDIKVDTVWRKDFMLSYLLNCMDNTLYHFNKVMQTLRAYDFL